MDAWPEYPHQCQLCEERGHRGVRAEWLVTVREGDDEEETYAVCEDDAEDLESGVHDGEFTEFWLAPR